jgi:hypothetical protein
MDLPTIERLHKKSLDHNHNTTLESMPSVVMVQSGNETRLNETRLEGVKNCKHCGKQFVANHKIQVYCNTECRLNAHNFRLYRKKTSA